MGSPKKILILDGEQRSALAATRALGKLGFHILVGSEQEKTISGSSKYCLHHFQYPSPYLANELFISAIKDIIKTKKVDFLLPMTDVSVFSILTKQDDFIKIVHLLCGSLTKYLAASDKMNLVNLSRALNIPVPESIFIESTNEMDKLKRVKKYPVVLKPQASLIKNGNVVKQVGVKIVDSYNKMIETIKNNRAFQHPFMVQEKIEGEGLGVFSLCSDGDIKALFSHRRLREKPPWGGVSVLCESTKPHAEASLYSKRLLKHLSWNGVAMVEFKMDSITGTPKLMEINARFWGSLQLSIDSGVNFPKLLMEQEMGMTPPTINEYNKSRLRWLLGDTDNLYIRLKTKNSDKKLPPGCPGKVETIYNYFKEFFQPTRFELCRKDDLNPFLFEVKQYFFSAFNSKL